MRGLDWSREYVFTADGRPYDHAAYPHLGAPGGPWDAYDDPRVRQIYLQWASRLGKSFFGQCCTLHTSDCQPGPIMFASADEKLAEEVIGRTYKMVERCPVLREQLRPERLRRDDRIDLRHCIVYVAWARSVSTLADKSIRVGHANEIDKWVHLSTSKEGDPLALFENRFKDHPNHKQILESTPTQKKRSRVERGLAQSTNCRYWVPCPHCGRYQRLLLGRGNPEEPGVVWEKLPTGRNDADLARKTATYRCAHCPEPICDHHRPAMMRAGVWVPEGCAVSDAKAAAAATRWPLIEASHAVDYLTGHQVRDGRVAGYQLSSLYALTSTWGEIAERFVRVKSDTGALQDFVNSWLGETYERNRIKLTWEELGAKLIVDVPHGVVPRTMSLVVVGVDKQDDRFEWVADAWGPERTSHTLDYGACDDLDDLEAACINRTFPHQDGGAPLRPAMVLIDSGFRPKGVYEFCRGCLKKGWKVLPCKGSSKPLNATYRKVTLGKDTSMPGMILVHVDTQTTQDWLDRQLRLVDRGAPGGAALFAAPLGEHQDFLEQLLNDAAVAKLDSRNYASEVWERPDPTLPNDKRDCRRYGMAAMLLATRGAPILPRGALPPAKPPDRPALTMPDGRPYLITERAQ